MHLSRRRIGQGRYIKGKTLTVAVWDDCKNPLVVWRFCGDYWTGELRREKNPCRRFLRPDYIDTEHGRSLLRTDVAATQHESELLQNYFDDHRTGDLIRIVDNALSAASRKKREIRDAKQAKETKKMLATLPEIPWDIHKEFWPAAMMMFSCGSPIPKNPAFPRRSQRDGSGPACALRQLRRGVQC